MRYIPWQDIGTAVETQNTSINQINTIILHNQNNITLNKYIFAIMDNINNTNH